MHRNPFPPNPYMQSPPFQRGNGHAQGNAPRFYSGPQQQHSPFSSRGAGIGNRGFSHRGTRPDWSRSPSQQQHPSSPLHNTGSPLHNTGSSDFIPLTSTPRHSSPYASPYSNQSAYQPQFPARGRFKNRMSSPANGEHGFRRQNQSFGRGNSSGSDCNPGGSSNIQNYYHPSMLEDPWANLTPSASCQGQ